MTKRLRAPGSDEYVVFSDNGKAQVTKDVGEQLIEQVESVVPVEGDESAADSDESGDESDASDED